MKRFLAILGLALTLSSCATTGGAGSGPLKQQLPNNSKIAVISTFNNQANFSKVGVTVFSNANYKHSIPNFNSNKLALKAALNELRYKKNVHVVASKSMPTLGNESPIAYIGLTSSIKLPDQYLPAIKQFIQKYPADYVIVVGPGVKYIPSGMFGDTIKEIGKGYGVLSVPGSLTSQNAEAYFVYNIVLVDTKTWTVLASTSGGDDFNLPEDAFQSKFEKISASNIELLKSGFSKNVTKYVSQGIRRLNI